MKKSSVLFVLMAASGICFSSVYAQKRLVLDLNQTIALANDSSLESFRTQNMYLSGYWEYRTYRANRLPSLTMDLTPAQYNRDITKRYDSGQDLDVYRTQQSYYAYGGLSVRQNLDLTGGTFYLESNLAYMRNFGDNSATQFTSVPIRLGYSQSLVGYNPFKWDRKIEPLKYERVKKEFLYNVEKVSETATNYFFSLAMAQAGAVIVSGLADGLDSEAHRAALQADRPTIAFLGTAIDKTYPAANARLRTAIEKGGGAVCSEYPPGYTGRTTGTFLARNRLIAAQSEALCVAEARTRSGTLNTVHHAERLGRPVLAVPGSIYSALSEGTNELLRTHRAEPLCKAADVLEILGIGAQATAPEKQRFDPAAVSPDAQQVYAALKPTPQGIDALCAATRLPAGRVLAACTELELMGGAQVQPGRRYIAE